MANLSDERVRLATFEWLGEQVERYGDVLDWSLLLEGFVLEGERVSLVSPRGIFKPRGLDVPLSIRTAPESPYDDGFGADELLRYRYQGTDPEHRDNRGLREAMRRERPLVYFFGLVPGRYLPTWPVYIVGDNREALEFSVAVDDAVHIGSVQRSGEVRENETAIRREYVTSLARIRVHQRAFRERVLAAYRRECAFCRFRHEELLDAAHIAADATPEGEPRVSNGLALCRLHHAAFDAHFVGLKPDLTLTVRPDILREQDGPTLVHGIQALEGQKIVIPRTRDHRPDIGLVEARFTDFLANIPRAS